MYFVQNILYDSLVNEDILTVVFGKNSLMPRIPAGTASTSALDKIAWSLAASFRSPSEGFGLLRSLHNLIVARGAKFGMPLTVPWPPDETHGVRSAIRPSRSRNGYGRELFIVGSSLSAAFSRINFPILPPHLLQLVVVPSGFCQ
jgi:hypothetical protein